jgi:phosphate transport system substrate-binding protein
MREQNNLDTYEFCANCGHKLWLRETYRPIKVIGKGGFVKANITNGSALGAKPATMRVINRPESSGTHDSFLELVLNPATFGTTPNITTHPTDETTGIIRLLNADGISYASNAQVKDQKSVRVVDIDGFTPNSPNYPFKRQLFYVYKEPMSPAVKFFLDYLNSNDAKRAIKENKSEIIL